MSTKVRRWVCVFAAAVLPMGILALTACNSGTTTTTVAPETTTTVVPETTTTVVPETTTTVVPETTTS